MEKEKKLVELLLEKGVSLYYIEDEIEYLEDGEELIKELGEFEVITADTKKDGRNCIQTAIVHFKDHDFFIKEEAIGPCHYKDVMIDGGAYETNYYLVDAEVKQVYAFVNERKI